VACVTPARRVAGREVTTLEGLDPGLRSRWAEAFSATGASQCGFCTPGIVMRLASLGAGRPDSPGPGRAEVERALLAHLCRCTGWRSIVEAAALAWDTRHLPGAGAGSGPGSRDLDAAARRAEPPYLEPDASGCEPGGAPASPLANGGAFGGKSESVAPAVARRLADETGRAVRVLLSREDVVRLGAKRPPLAAGARADGSG